MWRLHLAHHTDLADVRLEEIPAVVVATGSGWGALSEPSRTHTEQRKNVVFPQGYPCWRFVGVRSLSVAPNLRFPRAQSRDVRPTREASGSALTVVGPPGVVSALVLKQHRLAQPPQAPCGAPSPARASERPRGVPPATARPRPRPRPPWLLSLRGPCCPLRCALSRVLSVTSRCRRLTWAQAAIWP